MKALEKIFFRLSDREQKPSGFYLVAVVSYLVVQDGNKGRDQRIFHT